MRRRLAIHTLGLFGILAGCSGAPPAPTPPPTAQPVATLQRPEPLKWVDPPPSDVVAWSMPELPHRAPAFPRLVGETESTHSVGDVSDGWLADSVSVSRPHPNLAFLQVQRERDLHYTTPEMLALIEAGAAHVQKTFPNSPLWLGNFSAPGGGDIPYSVSHNSGRDADVGFYLLDSEGAPIEPPDLLPLDRAGRFEAEDGTTYSFDVPRNWAFIEGLMRFDADRIQYIFVSTPLRRKLLRYAREQGVDAGIVSEAATRLLQPAGSLPHNDHFHIRIYCATADLVAGCVEMGRLPPGYNGEVDEARQLAARRIREAASSDDAAMRAAAVRRMVELEMYDGLDDLVVDRSPLVRAAAARAALRAKMPSSDLATRLGADPDPRVFAELVSALAEIADERALEVLIATLDQPRPVELPARQILDGRLLVVQSLAAVELADPVPALIAQIDESESMEVAVLGALRQLTNARAPEGTETAPWWNAWWQANRSEPRERWLAQGFREAGYAVEKLDLGSVWGLVRAVRDPRPWIAWNAQRALQTMSTSDAPTLSWSTYDAWYYWRWWFQKKTSQRGVPDVPEDLDVDSHPYQKPEERGQTALQSRRVGSLGRRVAALH